MYSKLCDVFDSGALLCRLGGRSAEFCVEELNARRTQWEKNFFCEKINNIKLKKYKYKTLIKLLKTL